MTKNCDKCGKDLTGIKYFLYKIVLGDDAVPVNKYICMDCKDGDKSRNDVIEQE